MPFTTVQNNQPAPNMRLVKGDVEIVNFDITQTPHQYLAQYAVGYNIVLGNHHPQLNALSFDDILTPDHGITFALINGDVSAALYYKRTKNLNRMSLVFMGVISLQEEGGLSSPMIAASFKAEKRKFGGDIMAKADVRILPDGDVNVASAKSFTRVGFYPTKQFLKTIQPANMHLHLTSEPNKKAIRGLVLEATDKDLSEASPRILSDWYEVANDNA
ncbi:MAG: hypothetical protein COC24_002105 [Alphaproteobacteria bacterium]|nr:hypothetical protein [Alphaproteobacteria bacterium]